MTSAAQLEANRRNAQHSTGPRTGAGKARSSQNAVKHGFTGRLLVGLRYGPFADNPAELQEFIQSVLEELQPGSAQERAEALNIVACTYDEAVWWSWRRWLWLMPRAPECCRRLSLVARLVWLRRT